MVPISGRLLVASPMLLDPNFARTVVLMLAHGDEGALGLVLNRPSEVDVGQVLPDAWRTVSPEPHVLFVGGPVGSDSVIGLARVRGEGDGFVAMAGAVGTVDLEKAPDAIGEGVESRVSSPGTRGGVRGSSKRSSRCRAGSWSTPSRVTHSRPIPTTCGEQCSSANLGGSRGSRTSLTR